MYENDPLGQLTNVIMPKLIEKLKANTQDIADIKRQLAENNDAVQDVRNDITILAGAKPADEGSVRQLLDMVQTVREEFAALKEQVANAPAPETKVRKPRKKKAQAPLVRPDDLTCEDVLYANYALRATKGNVCEACAIMPDISEAKMAYIEQMSTEEIDELYNPDNIHTESIPLIYAQTNWREVQG